MSGVYIKGLQMPKHWRDCMFSNGAAQCCLLNMESCGNGIPCPLILVPDHGRLIDADVLEADVQDLWLQSEISNGDWIGFRETLNRIPTVIPSDKEEDT